MKLDALYHWSPRERRAQIREKGLLPYSQSPNPPCDPQTGETLTREEFDGYACICLGTDPALAWQLSGDMSWACEFVQWDLWLVTLEEKDEVHFRSEWGPQIKEVRCNTPIPPDRVWYVGTRGNPPDKS